MRVLAGSIILAALGAAIGMMANWIPRPAWLGGRRPIVLVAVLVLATGVVSALMEPAEPAGTQQARVTGTTGAASEPARRRSKQAWVSEVNLRCKPVIQALAEQRARYERLADSASEEELLAMVQGVEDVLAPLVRDLNRIELPSAPGERAQADQWLRAYNFSYQEFVRVVGGLEEYVDAGTFTRLFRTAAVERAVNEFREAGRAAKGKGDALGVECPWSDVVPGP